MRDNRRDNFLQAGSERAVIEEWQRREESLAELCRRYEISRQTGYKWLERYQLEGKSGLEERSRAHCITLKRRGS